MLPSPTVSEPPINLLSLDGGGILGASGILVLHAIMKGIKRRNGLDYIPKPCEYFHLIGGSGTGGIIAIMLGRLKMSTRQALRRYNQIASRVFSCTNQRHLKDGRFEASALETEMKSIVKGRKEDYKEDELLIDPESGNESMGNAFACALMGVAMKYPQRLRTYRMPNGGPVSNCTIWEAVRATTAAPALFNPIDITGDGNYRHRFVGTSTGNHNPAKEVRDEAMRLYGGSRRIGVFVSIGMGQPVNDAYVFRETESMQKIFRSQLVKVLTSTAMDCKKVADELARQYSDIPGTYFRFNVRYEVEKIGLDEWDSMDEVLAHADSYIRDPEVFKSVKAVVACLYQEASRQRNCPTLATICMSS
ncbi:acyl transferase/acyl hydrolase/lysophospholipase [Desarmillaria tabescens]|uniref:Acyl transferase/acyl hydrolase/lysophospholipase n=1 Tax=Armillaria tabescens TaxID=1929756 RepID=A0AA39NNQ3_ARMTA|nr:acyl transferase/acyl hydrolase/lysophospholipase [Desarmillaria tabescens]KAK0469021.1 acyl transferase/acyl hydrolase/lysophospholipase [Desarmillaria tabescens]